MQMLKLYDEKLKDFRKSFDYHWSQLMDTLFFQQEQFMSGNRLRPYIVFAGYLSTKNISDVCSDNIDFVSRLSISVEIIHKASLILDDFFDHDPKRHGKMTFHEEYGTNNTVMYSANLLSIAVKNLNDIIQTLPETSVLKVKGIDTIAATMYDMSLGELKELRLGKSTNKYDINAIKDIISLETSTIISNSLLLGYYSGDGQDLQIESALKSIGYDCGYLFQVMNDMEPFCNPDMIRQHKGRLNTDNLYSNKNIVIALLYGLLSSKEHKSIDSITLSEKDKSSLLIHYFNYYNVKQSFLREMNQLHENIKCQIQNLSCDGIAKDWCVFFEKYVDIIIAECKKRIS